MYGALRAVKLYPVENDAVQKALAELTHHTKELLGAEGELELRISGEFIFVNSTRLRLDLDNYASFSHLLSLFRATGVGTLARREDRRPEGLADLPLVAAGRRFRDPAERRTQLVEKLANARASTSSRSPRRRSTAPTVARRRRSAPSERTRSRSRRRAI